MLDVILPNLQQCCFIDTVFVYLTGLPAVQICLLMKMHGTLPRVSEDEDHRLLSGWKFVFDKNLQQQIVSSLVLKCLESLIKWNSDVVQC